MVRPSKYSHRVEINNNYNASKEELIAIDKQAKRFKGKMRRTGKSREYLHKKVIGRYNLPIESGINENIKLRKENKKNLNQELRNLH
mmetsp:Transcript_3675/g.5434  ORF Transcript_3675/g.5434 Transcript_3675/m.5434 type:complete len:87 (-) Transcript_3675:40-300(-)